MNKLTKENEVKYQITVIVVSYCPNYQKLFQTLYSVIIQKEICFEVIVSDDGTPDFDEDRVAEWFEKMQFKHYKILNNYKNKGTVKNVFHAMECVRGKFVKVISPGDYLYEETVLKRVYAFIIENNSKCVFGKGVYYSQDSDGGEIKLYNKSNPRYIRPYLKKNNKLIQKNYLLYRDYALGAAFICETDILYKYMTQIVDKVIYAEDTAFILMVADSCHINYWNEWMIWYEYGTGISNIQSSKWQERIYQDNKECFKIIKAKHKQWEKAYNLYFEEMERATFWERVRYFLHNKKVQMHYYVLHSKKINCDIKLLQDIIRSETDVL